MATSVQAVGRSAAVTNVARSDIWSVGGTYVFPAAPVQMSVVSTSVNDTAAGTGIQQIFILYLDNTYTQQQTIVNMNGTTPVLTIPTNILRINKVFSTAVGTGGSAAGVITITNGGHTYAQIATGYTASRSAIVTVPANSNAFITHFTCSALSATANIFTEFDIRASSIITQLLPGVFVTLETIGMGNGGAENITFNPPLIVPATADIKVSASVTVGTATATCTASFGGYFDGTVLT